MATTPADQRPMFISAALFAAALGIVAVRYVNGSTEIESRPLPSGDVHALSAFVAPLPDTSVLASAATSGIVVARDPFVAVGVAPISGRPGKTVISASPRMPSSAQPWIVSTILVEGSNRSAIVNNMWVSVGDSLAGGSHLTAVERDHVVVTDAQGIRHTVSIQGGESW
jgi:hypothetical protein